MKRIIYLSLVLLAVIGMCFPAVAKAQAPDVPATGASPDRYYYGNCSYDEPLAENALGYNTKIVMQFYSRLARSKMRPYSGGQVIGVRVGVADTLTADAFLKDKVSGDIIVRKTAKLQKGWNEVIFDEPYEIGDAEICFGYECVGEEDTSMMPKVRGIYATDGNKENAESDGFYWLAEGSTPMSMAKDYGNLLVQLIVTGVPQRTENLAQFSGIEMPLVKNEDGTVNVDVKIRNIGSNVISSMKIKYSVGSNPQEETEVTGDLAGQAIRTVRISGLTAKKGDTFSAEVSYINGNRIAQTPKVSGVFNMAEMSYERKVLMEHFTTEQCGNCPRADKYMHSFFAENYTDEIVWASHHAGYEEDPFTLQESRDLLFMFGPDGTFAPGIMIDRRVSQTFGYKNPYPVHSIDSDPEVFKIYFDEALRMPAPLSVDIKEEYDSNTRQLAINVSGEISLEDIDLSNAYLNVWILEDSVKAINQMGTGYKDEDSKIPNEWWHENLIRKCVTGFAGVALEADGNTYSMDFTTDIPEGWRIGRCRVVAFVSRDINGNGFDAYVYNTNQIYLSHYGAVKDMATDKAPFIYVENNAVVAPEGAELTVVSLGGMTVPNRDLAQGMYVVRVEYAGKVYMQKVMVP